MNNRILVTIGDRFAKPAKSILATCGDAHYWNGTREELISLVKDVNVLLVGLEQTIDAEILDAAKKMQIIATATTGLDHIDKNMAEAKGITVLSLRDDPNFLRSVTSTAELALGLMIALARHIPAAVASVQNGEWNRAAFEGHQLAGKTLGIVGLGRLGSLLAGYGTGLGMQILYCDPAVSQAAYERVSFEELLIRSDVISLHVHLDKETEGMFDAAAFKKMKPTALLVNTARGAIVEEQSLVEALNDGTIAGYAADVLAGEINNAQANSPLIAYAKSKSNVILTPHIGGMTAEARMATDIRIAEMVRERLQNQ